MRYSLHRGIARKIKNKILNISASTMLVAMSLGGALPAFITHPAVAAPGIVYSNSGFGSLNLQPDRTTPSGGYTLNSNGLKMSIDNTKASTKGPFYQTEGLKGTIPASRSIKADLFVPNDWAHKPVRAGLWGVAGSDTTTSLGYPIIEYTTLNDYTGWRVWDFTGAGGWNELSGVNATTNHWYTLEITYNAATQNYDYYINNALVDSEPAEDGTNVFNKLQGVIFDSYNSATNNTADNYYAWWRNFKTGQVPTVQACTTKNTLNSSTLNAWDTTDTRSAGHYKVTQNGLHIWTDDGSSNAKVAAYYPTNFSLASTGTQNSATALTYDQNFGSAPGLQLVVDLNNDGTPDGILVGEGQSYPANTSDWWFTGSLPAPHATSIFGHPDGTLNEWLNFYPGAQVKAVGFSLGSGVHADGVIRSFTLGCTTYTFNDLPPTLTVTTPAENSFVSTKANGNKLVIKGSFTDDVKANYATFQLVHNGSSVAIGTLYGYGSVYNPAATYANADGSYTFNLPVPTNLADGQYSLFYTGTDFNGGITTRMERKFTIDNTAPSVPTLLTPVDRGYTKTNDFHFDWTDSTDANPGITYEFQSSQNPHTTNGVLDNSVWDNITNGNSEQKNLTDSKIHSTGAPDGTWYWQVRAIDAAGNKSAWTPVWHVTIDTQAPATTLNVENLNNGYVSSVSHGNKLTITGHATDALGMNRVLVQLLTSSHGAIENHTVYLTGTSQDWSTDFDVHTLGLHDGKYSVVAVVTDNAGNTSAKGQYLDFTLDNTAPVVQSVNLDKIANNLTSAAMNSGDNGSLAVTITTDEPLTTGSEVFLGSRAGGRTSYYSLKQSGTGNTYVANVDLNDPFLAGKTLGDVYLRIRTEDSLGNHAWTYYTVDANSNFDASGSRYYFTVDNTAPTLSDITVTPNNDGTYTFSGSTDDPNSPVVVTLDSITLAGVNIDSNGNWNVTVPKPAAGSHTVTANSTDAASNVATQVEAGFGVQGASTVLGGLGGGMSGPSSQNQASQSSFDFSPQFASTLGGSNANPQSSSAGSSTNTGAGSGSTSGVKGDSTTKPNGKSDSTTNSNFLGLGWWWLLILAAIAAFLAFIFRRSDSNEQA